MTIDGCQLRPVRCRCQTVQCHGIATSDPCLPEPCACEAVRMVTVPRDAKPHEMESRQSVPHKVYQVPVPMCEACAAWHEAKQS